MIGMFSMILVLIGFYGLITNRHILKMIVAVNVIELGINLFIVSVGYGEGLVAPIFTATNNNSALGFVDPLPQALVLTAIVIGVGTTALGLAIARKVHQVYGTYDIREMGVDK